MPVTKFQVFQNTRVNNFLQNIRQDY